MGTHKNLVDTEGIEKLRELAEDARTCQFATSLDRRPISTRPMGVQKVDDDGNLWFFSQRSSDKNAEIEINPEVQLFFTENKNAEYLTVYGTAEILRDQAIIDELWSGFIKTWFNKGKDDPEITLIKVTPTESYYWDTRHNKMVALIKIMTGALLGKQMDDGVEGRITVK